MDLEFIIAQMACHAESIRALVQCVSDEQARWKPNLESWSVLEVINHLCDEEREDFRARLDHILHFSGQPWPRIDPEGWVSERRYNQRDMKQSLHIFLRAREESLVWLGDLESPDWEIAYDAPFGKITAGDVLASWAMHDLLHTRQLVELLMAYTVRQVAPHRVEYAGAW